MLNILRREGIYLWYYFSIQFHQIAPYWAVGMVIGSLVSVFLKEHIHRLMTELQTRRMGTWGILPASALGILSPLCMYGTVPIAASFARSGMREDWIAAFMMSSILLNPQLFFYSFALGTELAVLRLLLCFLGGCLAGLLVRLCFRKQKFYSFTAFMIAGPATKLTNLGAVKIVLGGRNFLYYILFSILLAVSLGLVLNFIC